MTWLEPFRYEYMQLALAGGLVVGAVAPLIGTFLVHKRLSLMGDGIGHIAFAGVALGLVVNVWPIWTALALAILGALGIEWLRSRGGASGDLALATILYGGLAAGVVLASLGNALNANLLTYLFGAILTIQPSDLWVIGGLGLVIVAAVVVTGRALFATLVDEESARVAGLPVDGLNAMLSILTAVTIVAAMRITGVLLIAALMVLPVATSRLLARSFKGTLIGAVAFGVGAVVVGLVASSAWGLASGGTIVLVAGVVFALVSIARRGGRRWVGLGPSGVHPPVEADVEPPSEVAGQRPEHEPVEEAGR